MSLGRVSSSLLDLARRAGVLLPFVVLVGACGNGGSPNTSPARVLYQVDGKLQAVTYLVVQGEQVYVSIGDAPGVTGEPNELLAVPKEIGPAKVLVQRQENDDGQFSSDATHLYFADSTPAGRSSIESLSTVDGTTRSLADVTGTTGVLFANGSLYWVDAERAEGTTRASDICRSPTGRRRSSIRLGGRRSGSTQRRLAPTRSTWAHNRASSGSRPTIR